MWWHRLQYGHLFAGDVASLNNTLETADARRVTSLVEYDLQKDRVEWSFESPGGARGSPTPGGRLPTVLAASYEQPEVGKILFEATDKSGAEVPNDFCISGFGLDSACGSFWEEGNTPLDGPRRGGPGWQDQRVEWNDLLDEADSWAGDNDGYRIAFPEAGFVSVELTGMPRVVTTTWSGTATSSMR